MAIILDFWQRCETHIWRTRRVLYEQSHSYQKLSEMKDIWAQQKVMYKMFEVSNFAANDILLKVHINYDNDKTSWQSQKQKKKKKCSSSEIIISLTAVSNVTENYSGSVWSSLSKWYISLLYKLSSFILVNGDTVTEAMKKSKIKTFSFAAQKSKAVKIRSLDLNSQKH